MAGRILIVDDNFLMGGLLKDFLESRGHEAVFVESAEEALAKVEAESFDVVVTDYSMPGMNGVEFTWFARKIRPSLPVIGISMRHMEKAFLEAGADHFLLKPFELKDLKDAVDRHLKGTGKDG